MVTELRERLHQFTKDVDIAGYETPKYRNTKKTYTKYGKVINK